MSVLEMHETMELGELLQFVEHWLAEAPPAVEQSFARFLGASGYDLVELRTDLRRFAFLLGEAETFFGETP